MEDGVFSKAQMSALNGIIKSSVQRAIREELIPQMQDLLTKQLSTFHRQEPLIDQSLAHRQQFLPPLPPSLSSDEYETDRRMPRLEDIGLFDPPANTLLPADAATSQGKYTLHHDVFSFTDTLKLYGEEVCKGLFWKSCLRGQALNWWLTELSGLQRELMKTARLETVCDTLIERFKMPSSSALDQLNRSYYAYVQIRNGKHISEHLSTCFRLCRHAGFKDESSVVLSTWNTLDAQIRVVLGALSTGSKELLISRAIENWSTIHDLATRWRPPNPYINQVSTSSRPVQSSSPSKPFQSSPSKPSGPYVNRPYVPNAKQIDNKAYMAGVAGDRAYLNGHGEWRYLEYEDDPVESPNREGEID